MKHTSLLGIYVLVFAAVKSQITNAAEDAVVVRDGGEDGHNYVALNAEGERERLEDPDEERGESLTLEGHLKSAVNDFRGANVNHSEGAAEELRSRNSMESDEKMKDFLKQMALREYTHDHDYEFPKTLPDSEWLFHIFQDFDSNGDVHLDGIEITKIIMALEWRRGHFATHSDSHFSEIIDPIFGNYDVDDDGQLSYPEFRKLFETFT